MHTPLGHPDPVGRAPEQGEKPLFPLPVHQFPGEPPQVLATLVSPLALHQWLGGSQVVFVADFLEPSKSFGRSQPYAYPRS